MNNPQSFLLDLDTWYTYENNRQNQGDDEPLSLAYTYEQEEPIGCLRAEFFGAFKSLDMLRLNANLWRSELNEEDVLDDHWVNWICQIM